MRAHEPSRLLLLLGLLALTAVPVAAAAEPEMAPADGEQETDDLPPWAQIDLDADAPPEAQVRMFEDYGADIPDPEDVMAGRRARPVTSERETAPPPAAAPAVQFDDFHSELSPHGRWVDTPEYGMVFVPTRQTQVAGWRPYLYGQWAWTSYGWTWVSEEPFGWATYHYGRWAYRPVHGWVWVPGYTWGPAWVAWRYGEGAIGWAPLYPGYVTWTTSYPYHVNHWIFVGPTRFYGHPIHRHWYRDRSDYYYGRSAYARNWRAGGRGHVYTGPPVRRIESATRGRVMQSRVIAVGSSRRGEAFSGRSAQSAGEVRIYRPTNRGAVRGRDSAAGVRSGGASPRPADRSGSRGTDRRGGAAPSGVRTPDRQVAPARSGPSATDRRASPSQPASRSGTSPRPGDDRRSTPGSRSQGQVQPGPRPGPARQSPSPGTASPRSSLQAPPSSARPSSSASLRSGSSPRPSPSAPSRSSSSPSPSSPRPTSSSSSRSGSSPAYSSPRPSPSPSSRSSPSPSSRSSSSSSSRSGSSSLSSSSPRSMGPAGSLRPAPTVRTQHGSSRAEVSRPNLSR
ncbi:MAG TPA: DUF6600 domain-containing protein [Vulgatibacter sp.]